MKWDQFTARCELGRCHVTFLELSRNRLDIFAVVIVTSWSWFAVTGTVFGATVSIFLSYQFPGAGNGNGGKFSGVQLEESERYPRVLLLNLLTNSNKNSVGNSNAESCGLFRNRRNQMQLTQCCLIFVLDTTGNCI